MSRPHPEEPRFRLLAREEPSFPCVFGKEFPAFPSHLKKRHSPRERRGELQGRATITRVLQMSKSIQGKPVFPALFRLSSRGSTHTTVARGTVLRESLVGKPRGKATDPLIHTKGCVTLLLLLGRKAHVHAPSREEDLLPWGDSRCTPRSMSELERNPQVPAPTSHKILGSVIDVEESREAPEQLARGLPFPEATRAGP